MAVRHAVGRWGPRRSRRQDRALEAACDRKQYTFLIASPPPPPEPDSDKALRAAWADGPRRRREGLEALLDFIALPRDEAGRPIIPQSRVTALVEARDAWASELGTLDASHPLYHAGAAGHAPDIGAIAADGSAQSPVVGER